MPEEKSDINWLFRVDFSYCLFGSGFNGSLSKKNISNNLDEVHETLVVDLATLKTRSLFDYGLGAEYAHIDWSDCASDYQYSGKPSPDFHEVAMVLQQRLTEVDVLQQKVATYYVEHSEEIFKIYPEVPWSLDSFYQETARAEAVEACSDNPQKLPGWVLLHIPHASTKIPERVRDQFVLPCGELEQEAMRFADLYTDELFASSLECHAVTSGQSRLVVDVERFADDAQEPMAAKGLGVIYRNTSGLAPLRRDLSTQEKLSLLSEFYKPHHAALSQAVEIRLALFGQCLLVDCHSFPDEPFAYEEPSDEERPGICLGTDPFHTPVEIAHAMEDAFVAAGFSVKVNHPFSGSLVPAAFYQTEPRVQSIMVEVNKRLYMDAHTFEKTGNFDSLQANINAAIRTVALAF